MTVDVHRESHGRMTRALANDLRVDACGESERRVRVPQVVKPDARKTAVLHVPVEELRETIWMVGQSVRAFLRFRDRNHFATTIVEPLPLK